MGGSQVSKLVRNVPIVNSLEMSPFFEFVVVGLRPEAEPVRAKRKGAVQTVALPQLLAACFYNFAATDGPAWRVF